MEPGLPSKILCANVPHTLYVYSRTPTPRVLISPRLSCFAASAAQGGVSPLILRALTQQLGLAVGPSSNFFHPKITPETISENQKSKIFRVWGGGACSQTPVPLYIAGVLPNIHDECSQGLAPSPSFSGLPHMYCERRRKVKNGGGLGTRYLNNSWNRDV